MGVAFRLLGKLRVCRDDRPVTIQYPRQRTLLAALLVDLNTVVPTDVLTDRVWGDDLPDAPRAALHTYLSRVRKSVGPEVEITQRSGGYLLVADPATVDLHRFRRLVADARGRADDEAAAALTEALAEWHGDAFTGLDGPWVTELRAVLDQERLLARMDLYDIRLRQYRHEELLPELRDLAGTHPLDERLAAQLVLALHRSGHRGEALERYRHIRTRLADELGMDPGETLREAYREINRVVPRQLPAAVATFIGRTDYLDQLDDLLPGNTVVISALSGMGGIGKTTLAVHWAHRVAGHFPDGQLYLDLRGFDGTGAVMAPREAIRTLLDGLGVPPRSVPVPFEAQTALFRELVANRRLLVVLDNARDADQVRPLLPDAPGCLVVVTSRDRLADLAESHHAQTLALDLLSPAEAEQLLAERLGADRVHAEPAAVAEIITRCAQLPLALAVTAAHAAARPTFPLSSIAVELGDDINAVFSWSYRALGELAARAFRLLSVHPAPDFHLVAAASLIALPVADTRHVLGELCQASLLSEYVPGRYRFHDLVRAYAATEASTMDDADAGAARVRMLDHYLHTAHGAAMRISPLRSAIQVAEPRPDIVVVDIPDRAAANAWFAAEHVCLAAVTQYASDHGHPVHCWQLAWTVVDFLHRNGMRDEQVQVQRLGLAAAEQAGDLEGQVYCLRGLARAAARLGAFEDAYRYLDAAFTIQRKIGGPSEEASVHLEFAATYLMADRPVDALRHAEQAMSLEEASGNRFGQSKALSAMGYCHALLDNHQVALTCCHRSLDLEREYEDRLVPGTTAETLDTIGLVHFKLGDHAEAIRYYQMCLELSRGGTEVILEGAAWDRIGDVHWAGGEHEAARRAWQAGLAVLGDTNPPASEQLRIKLARPG